MPKGLGLTLIQQNGTSRIYGTNGPGFPKRQYRYKTFNESHSSLPLLPLFAGSAQSSARCYRRRENSDLYAVELIEQGTKHVTQDGEHYVVKAGDVYLVRKGATCILDPQTTVKKHCVAFLGPQADSVIHTLGLHQFTAATVSQADRDSLLAQMKEVYQALKSTSTKAMAQASQATYGILLTLSQYRPSTIQSEVRMAVEYMQARIGSHITLEACANHAGVSISTLKRQFTKAYGVSPIAFYLTLKLNAAKQLLRHSELAVSDIARQLGYSSAVYFSNEFKKREGVSPRAYRKEASLPRIGGYTHP